ncbi:MAG: AraC family transcriptional regulator [Firmicutes bacterium]|nr:AraC family transcriptional regulator [Bacillota bacterium]
MAKHTMTILADGSEQVFYNDPVYPVYANQGKLSRIPRMRVIHHWHDDMEFIAVQKGHMMYSVNGEHILLEEGEGIYVAPRQVHRNYSEDGTDCIYLAVLINPSVFRSRFQTVETAVQEQLNGDGCPYIHLSQDVPWQKKLMELITEAHPLICSREENRFLQIMGIAYEMLFLLTENMPKVAEGPRPDRRIPTLRDMVNYIQTHYAEKVTIADISRAGKVGSSTCYDLFKKHLDTTPQNYLMDYRLEKSLELLNNPGLSITDIAFATGFGGASYFTECFRKHYHLTPSAYRAKMQEEMGAAST